MKKPSRKFWLLAFAQIFAVIGVLTFRFYSGRSDYLIHKTDHDWHSLTWSFFGASFAIEAVVFATIVAVLIGLQYVVWGIVCSRRE